MKFTQLPIGQRFELEGAVYVKTSPMMAVKEGGGESRFMARYVVVKVLGGEEIPAQPRQARRVEEEAVRAAFEQYHSRCRKALEQLAGDIPAEKLELLLAEGEDERRRFLDLLSGC